MQRLFWRWKDDDLTSDMNSWLLGIIPIGLVRGFDAVLDATMNLTLTQTISGVVKTLVDTTQSNPIGIVTTPQGAVVTEDSAIVLPIEPGGLLPRIDTIYIEHIYTAVVGGTPATYGVIKGVENANPVAPALISPNIEVKLGQLYVPAGATALTSTIYTREPNAKYGDNNYAHRDEVNVYSKQSTEAPEAADASYNVSSKTLAISAKSNKIALPNTIDTTNYLEFIPIKPSGTELALRVTSTSLLIKTGVTANAINNLVEGIDSEYSLGVVLYLRSNGIYWDLYDVSSKSILRDHNLYQGTSQRKFSTNGVKIKGAVYTVGANSYLVILLEINPLADYFVLDLTDPTLTGGFDLATGVVSCSMIDVLPGLKDSGNGFKANIFIKSNVGGKMTMGHSAGFVLNPAFRQIGNPAIINNLQSGTSGIFKIFNVHDAVSIESTVSELEITLLPDNKFIFNPITRLNQITGSTDYATNTIGVVGSDSHKNVINKLLVNNTPIVQNYSGYLPLVSVSGTLQGGGISDINVVIIGKVCHWSIQGNIGTVTSSPSTIGFFYLGLAIMGVTANPQIGIGQVYNGVGMAVPASGNGDSMVAKIKAHTISTDPTKLYFSMEFSKTPSVNVLYDFSASGAFNIV